MENSRDASAAARSALAIAGFGTAAFAHWFEDETPPDNAKPLSAMIRGLEDQGYKKVTEVDYDDGVYDVEVHMAGGKEQHFKFNAVSGERVN